MTLTVERELSLSGGQRRRLPLLAGAAPVAGALLSWDPTGYVHGLVAGERFAGVCRVSVRKAFATDGEGQVDAVTGQFDLLSLAAIATIDATDVAAATAIYASDDATLTATAAGNTKVGAVSGIEGTRIRIAAASADLAGIFSAAAGGIFGSKTLVVSTAGDDTLGAASPYAAEFLTIQAAITAATAGDVVVVRPGTYSRATAITLKDGVNVHFLPGAKPVVTGNFVPMFKDNGAAIVCKITGDGEFSCTSNGSLLETTEDSTVSIDCMSVAFNASGTALLQQTTSHTRRIRLAVKGLLNSSGGILVEGGNGATTIEADRIISINGASVAKVSAGSTEILVRARTIEVTGNSPCCLVEITGGSPTINVEANESIVGTQIIKDTGSTGATRVSVKAPSITATVLSDYGLKLAHAAAARYDITTDVGLFNAVFQATNPDCELHIHARNLRSQIGTAALSIQNAGRAFLRCHEVIGGLVTNAAFPIYMEGTAELHVLGGRIRGRDGDASGHAILTSGAGPKLRLYPGTVLIAGDDVATKSIEADSTPTVVCMGDIAANKAANGGVVEAVGSLLVDAAVV